MLVKRLPPPAKLLADRAYDAVRIRDWLTHRSFESVISPSPTRKHLRTCDRVAYRGRKVVERMFCCLKNFRRIAMRYDKRAAAIIW